MGDLFLHISSAISQTNKEKMYPKAHVFLENYPSGIECSNNLMNGSSEKTQDSGVCGHYLDKKSISFKAVLNCSRHSIKACLTSAIMESDC